MESEETLGLSDVLTLRSCGTRQNQETWNPEDQNDKIKLSSLKPGDESSEFSLTLLTFVNYFFDNYLLCLCHHCVVISHSNDKKLSQA